MLITFARWLVRALFVLTALVVFSYCQLQACRAATVIYGRAEIGNEGLFLVGGLILIADMWMLGFLVKEAFIALWKFAWQDAFAPTTTERKAVWK